MCWCRGHLLLLVVLVRVGKSLCIASIRCLRHISGSLRIGAWDLPLRRLFQNGRGWLKLAIAEEGYRDDHEGFLGLVGDRH